jgi:hypothetical protein
MRDTDAGQADRGRGDQAPRAGTVGDERRPDSAAQGPDPNDEIPVPEVMSAAEIDERAQVVDTLRAERAGDAERGAREPTEPTE